MKISKTDSRFGLSYGGRVLRLVAPVALSMFALTGWQAASAAATVIHVNTTRETAVFTPSAPGNPNEPGAYNATITGDNSTPTECSLRQAINSANTHTAHFGCPAGDGNDTIVLPAGDYNVQDNFFILEKMTFQGPNAGVPGNAPPCSATRRRRRQRAASCRGPEAVLSLNNNPNYAAQEAMFWLGAEDQPSNGLPAEGAGTVFDGVVMQGGFVPACNVECDITAIVQPSQKTVDPGYTLTDSIVRAFSHGIYLGGTDTITRDLFEDNDTVPGSTANGWDIYSDFVYTSHDSIIDDNVFNNPDLGGVILQGDTSRGTVFGGQVEHNLFLKEANHDLGLYLIQTSGVMVNDNLFESRNVGALPGRLDSAIRMDRVDNVTITDNTITGWGNAIKIGGLGSGPPGVSATVAFNRFYDNLYGIQVTAQYATPADYMPLAVDANDDWWGANGGPGSTGARPGAIDNPVNGVQFFDSNGDPVGNQGGITVDRWLHLACSVSPTVQVNVPASVVGQVLHMPTVNVTSSTPDWFFADAEPLMAASAPGVGNVYGFDQVPDEGPNNAQITGTLLATNTGSGDVLVDLDSERVACPLTAKPGPEPDIGKTPDTPTVTAGGGVGFRITVTNRGRVTARNWWVCDRIPTRMTFVGATRRLRRLGGMRCLVIPRLRPHQSVSFHVTLRNAANDPGTTETNTAVVIPGLPGASTGQPPPAQKPIAKVSARVKVRHRAPSRPKFTG